MAIFVAVEEAQKFREIEHVKDIAGHLFRDNVYIYKKNNHTHILASKRGDFKGNYTAFIQIGKDVAKPKYRSNRDTNGTHDWQKLHSITRAIRGGEKVIHFSTVEQFNEWSKGGITIVDMIDRRFYIS